MYSIIYSHVAEIFVKHFKFDHHKCVMFSHSKKYEEQHDARQYNKNNRWHIYTTYNALESIKKKYIYNHTGDGQHWEILKAMKDGYKFSNEYLVNYYKKTNNKHNDHDNDDSDDDNNNSDDDNDNSDDNTFSLLKNNSNTKSCVKELYLQFKHEIDGIDTSYSIQLQYPNDLKTINDFMDYEKQFFDNHKLIITDNTNVETTLEELHKYFDEILHDKYAEVRVPPLLTFNSTQSKLMTEYIYKIIQINPSNNHQKHYVFNHKPTDTIDKKNPYWYYLSDGFPIHVESYEEKQEVDLERKNTQTHEQHDNNHRNSYKYDFESEDDSSDTDCKEGIDELSDTDCKEDTDESSDTDCKEDTDDQEETDCEEKDRLNIDISNDDFKEKYNSQIQYISLNKQGTSYITIDYLTDSLINSGHNNFTELYLLRPWKRHAIIMQKKELEVQRYSKSYLCTPTDLSHISQSSYMYSGYDTSSNTERLPTQFDKYYEHMKEKNNKYNQVVVNWYGDGLDHIAQHADCEIEMIPDATIAMISINQNNEKENDYRHMTIAPKTKKNKKKNKIIDDNIESNHAEYYIKLHHGMILTMYGKTQKEFTHGIEQNMNTINKRISLSFRQMKCEK